MEKICVQGQGLNDPQEKKGRRLEGGEYEPAVPDMACLKSETKEKS